VHLEDPAEPFFRRVELDVPTLAFLLGPNPVEFKKRLSNRSREARLTIDSRRRGWTADGVEFEAHYNWGVNHDELGVDLRMTPRIQLSSSTSRSFRYWCDEWLVPLNAFLQIATARVSRPNGVALWTKKHITPLERSTSSLDVWTAGIDPSAVAEFRLSDGRRTDPLVSIEQLEGVSIHEVLQRTKQFTEQQEVFCSLLMSTLTDSGRPLRNRYLDITAALEAYDSRVHGEGPVAVDEFKTQRKEALAAVGDPAAKKFLRRWALGRSSFSLEDRLRRAATTAGVTWQHDATTMAKVRNDIAHGNAHPSGPLLRDCFEQAFDVARRLALLAMGLD
jgi:hypothetical protein